MNFLRGGPEAGQRAHNPSSPVQFRAPQPRRASVITRAAAHDRELRRVQICGLIRCALLAAIFVCAILGAGCYAHTPTPSCAANPSQPQCPAPIHDEKR